MASNSHLDDPMASVEHGKKLKSKKILANLYHDFYKQILLGVPRNLKGKIVEIGSGGGFLQELDHRIITSDIMNIPGIDMVFPAERMPFTDSSIRAFLGLNVLHHIKNPAKAFSEIERCLKKRGTVSIIEPANTFWARFVYKNLHDEEFDEKAGWKSSKNGPLSESNIALPWIMFVRDRKIFRDKYQNLKIVKVKTIWPFMYLLTGGFTRWQFIPTFLYKHFKKIDSIFSFMGMFMYIKIVKK